MKKMYSTKMINTGGRSGEVHSPDHPSQHLVNGSKIPLTQNNFLPLVLVLVSTVLLNL